MLFGVVGVSLMGAWSVRIVGRWAGWESEMILAAEELRERKDRLIWFS